MSYERVYRDAVDVIVRKVRYFEITAKCKKCGNEIRTKKVRCGYQREEIRHEAICCSCELVIVLDRPVPRIECHYDDTGEECFTTR